MRSIRTWMIGILITVFVQLACLSSNFVSPPTPSLGTIGKSCNTAIENLNLSIDNSTTSFPIIEGTSIPKSPVVISPENASQLIRLARWGKGAAIGFEWIADGQKIALTTLYGIYIYDSTDLSFESYLPFEQDEAINVSNLSADGRLVAISAAHGPIQIWQISNKTLIREFSSADFSVRDLAVSKDGLLIAANVGHGKIMIWNVNDGKLIQEIESTKISGIDFSPDGKLIAAEKVNLLQLWSIDNGELVREFNHGDGTLIQSFDFSPDMRFIATTELYGNIKTWQASTGILVKEWDSGVPFSNSIAYSPDGKWVSFSGTSSGVYLFRAENGELEHIYEGNTDFLDFSPDGKSIALKSSYSTVQMLDLNNGQKLGELDTVGALQSLAISPDGKLIATGGSYLINLWDISTGNTLCTISAHEQIVFSIDFSHDGKSIVSGGYDGMMRLWNIENGTLIREIHVDDEKGNNLVYAVAFSKDGNFLVAGNSNPIPSLYRVVDGKMIGRLEGERDRVSDVAFSPNGHILALATDNTTELWDITSKQLMRQLEGFAIAVAFNSDGALIAVAGGREVVIWQVDNGIKLHTLQGYGNSINDVVFSPNGELIVTGDVDGLIKVWRVKDGVLLITLSGHRGYPNGILEVSRVEFNPDGTLLFSTGIDGTVGVWGIP